MKFIIVINGIEIVLSSKEERDAVKQGYIDAHNRWFKAVTPPGVPIPEPDIQEREEK